MNNLQRIENLIPDGTDMQDLKSCGYSSRASSTLALGTKNKTIKSVIIKNNKQWTLN